MIDHKKHADNVKAYREKSGHNVQYNVGGYLIPSEHYEGKREVQKGSLAKDKMRNLLAKSDSKANKSDKRLNIVGIVNDQK